MKMRFLTVPSMHTDVRDQEQAKIIGREGNTPQRLDAQSKVSAPVEFSTVTSQLTLWPNTNGSFNC